MRACEWGRSNCCGWGLRRGWGRFLEEIAYLKAPLLAIYNEERVGGIIRAHTSRQDMLGVLASHQIVRDAVRTRVEI